MANPNMFHHDLSPMDMVYSSTSTPVWAFDIQGEGSGGPQSEFPSSFHFAARNLSSVAPVSVLHPSEAVALSLFATSLGGSEYEGDVEWTASIASLLCPQTHWELLIQRSILLSPHEEFARQLYLHTPQFLSTQLLRTELQKSAGVTMLTKNVKLSIAARSRVDAFHALPRGTASAEEFSLDLLRHSAKLGDVAFLERVLFVGDDAPSHDGDCCTVADFIGASTTDCMATSTRVHRWWCLQPNQYEAEYRAKQLDHPVLQPKTTALKACKKMAEIGFSGSNGLLFTAIEWDHTQLLAWALARFQMSVDEVMTAYNKVGAQDPNETVLHFALCRHSYACFSLLWKWLSMREGADGKRQVSKDEVERAHYAALFPAPFFLLDAKGRNVLHYASERQDVEAMDLIASLLRAGDRRDSGTDDLLCIALSLPVGQPTRLDARRSGAGNSTSYPPPPRRGTPVAPYGRPGCLTLSLWGNRSNMPQKTTGTRQDDDAASTTGAILASPSALWLLVQQELMLPSEASKYPFPEYNMVSLFTEDEVGDEGSTASKLENIVLHRKPFSLATILV